MYGVYMDPIPCGSRINDAVELDGFIDISKTKLITLPMKTYLKMNGAKMLTDTNLVVPKLANS